MIRLGALAGASLVGIMAGAALMYGLLLLFLDDSMSLFGIAVAGSAVGALIGATRFTRGPAPIIIVAISASLGAGLFIWWLVDWLNSL